MKTLTDEEKMARRRHLDLLKREIDEDNIKRGWPPVNWVNKTGQHVVSFSRPSKTSSISSEQKAEKPISQMSNEEFREKAIQMLMEKHGYSMEQAEATVNSPY